MSDDHAYLVGAGQIAHHEIDRRLPTDKEKAALQTIADNARVNVSGARDNPEEALANLLSALATLGLITDNTTAS